MTLKPDFPRRRRARQVEPEPVERGPVHFLDGLRCPVCRTLNASWLAADGSAVECTECGQTSLTLGDVGEVA